jgi:uncharacterized protein
MILSGVNFFGRKQELKLLREAWQAERSAFIPIYGRRRIGKSELILHFMGDKPGLYFVGKRAPGGAQMKEFLEAAARVLNEPLLAQVRPTNWKDALQAVVERLPERTKFIIALDEFQWMAQASPELPSILQELWDRSWSRSGQILLILCGSYLGFMEREVLGPRSPLFGRRTAQIFLRPFNYIEAAAFHPDFSEIDQARIYAICGGIPAYLLSFEKNLSVEQNLIRHVLDDNAALAREPDFLLREELRDLIPYHAVLTTLAQGKSNPTQLAQATGLDVRSLNYFLTTLSEISYVQRLYPVTGTKPSVRSVRYAVDDPLLRFWFRFVFPHQSLIRLLGPERALAEIIQPELESYFGRCFERLCRESMTFLYLQEGVRTAFTVGEYWDSKVQIDVVGSREDNWTDLGECKWGTIASLGSIAADLESKIQLYPNKRNATIGRRLFLKKTPGKNISIPENLRIHTLQELYALG